MKNIFKIIILSLMLTFVTPATSQAQVKMDIAHIFNTVKDFVIGTAKTVKKKLDQSAALQTINKLGKGVKATGNKIKGYKDKVEDNIDAAKSTMEKGKQTVNSAQSVAGNTISTAQGAVGEVTDVSGVTGQIPTEALSAKELAELESQRSAIEQSYAQQDAALTVQYNGEAEAINNDIANLQKMINDMPEQRQSLENTLSQKRAALENTLQEQQTAIADSSASKERDLQAINDQIAKISQDAQGQATDALSNKAMDLFNDKVDVGSANQTTAGKAFLKSDDPESIEKVNILRATRNREAYNYNVKAMARVLQLKKSLDKSTEKADKIKDDTTMQDGTTDALTIDTALKVENMRSLINLLEVMILDMKALSSAELAKTQVYSMETPDADMSGLNLCKYKFSTKDYKKKLADKAKKLQGKGNDLLKKGKDLKNKADDTKGVLKDAKEVGGML